MFFLHISSPMPKYVKQYWTLDGNSTYISGVKCILRQYAFRPCVNLSCDYEIVFTIASRAAWNGSHVIVNVFHLLFVFELPLQQWICFPCACNCASFVWKCDRHFAIYSARSLEIQLSLPSVRRTILLPSSSEHVSYIVFSNVRVSKTVFFRSFFGHRPKRFWNDRKNLSHFGQNVWIYRLKNTVVVSCNTTVRQMTEMFQWPKCLSKKMTEMHQRKKTRYKTASGTSAQHA